MNYKPELIPPILADLKTQTRRPLKGVEWARLDQGGWRTDCDFLDKDLNNIRYVTNAETGRYRYEVGKDYALCPGRGKPAVMVATLRTESGFVRELVTEDSGQFLQSSAKPARIVIDRIRYEDVRCISVADSIAEGFKQPYEFLAVWCQFYDPAALRMHTEIRPYTVFDIAAPFGDQHKHDYLTDWSKALFKRPDQLYRGWVLEFHVR